MKIVIILLSILISLVFPPMTLAHVLKSDGSIGAILHVSPEDNPVAGEQSGFFFEFKDKDGKFKPELCRCSFSIFQAQNQLFTEPLFSGNTDPSLESASLFFTFPGKDVYKIKVSGTPITPGTFQAFNLEYDVRVAQEASAENTNTSQDSTTKSWTFQHIYHLIAIAMVLAFLVGIGLKKR